MKGKWLVVTVLVASVTLNLAAFGAFLYKRIDCPEQEEPILHEVRPEAKERVQLLHLELKPQMDSLRDEMRMARYRLSRLLRQTEPDPDDVELRLEEIAVIQKGLNRLAFENARRVGAELPPYQRMRLYQRFERHCGLRSAYSWTQGRGRLAGDYEEISGGPPTGADYGGSP